MSESAAVVVEQEVMEEAYNLGYGEFDHGLTDDEIEAGEPDLSFFKEGARWANGIAPRLRALAGYADRGYGTWTEDRPIVLLDAADVDDRPAEGDLMQASDIHDEVIEAFDRGAHAALRGEERDSEVVV